MARRSTRRAPVKLSRSGSVPCWSAAWCIRVRMARWANQQQAIDLLDHLAWVLAAQWARMRPLVDLHFVQGGLDLPPLVIRRRQLLRWEGALVQQRGHQPVLVLARTGRGVQSILD